MSDELYGDVSGTTHNELQREWRIQKNRADDAEAALAAVAEDRDRFYRISMLAFDANGESLKMLQGTIALANAAESPLLVAANALDSHAAELAEFYKQNSDAVEGNLHRMGGDAIRAGYKAEHFKDAAKWLRERVACLS